LNPESEVRFELESNLEASQVTSKNDNNNNTLFSFNISACGFVLVGQNNNNNNYNNIADNVYGAVIMT